MADVASGLRAAASPDELVVGPEGAVQEHEVGRGGRLAPFGIAAGECRRHEDLLAALLEEEADRSIVCRHVASRFFADVVRIGAAQRQRVTQETGSFTRTLGEMQAEATTRSESFPLHRRIGTFEYREDAILLLQHSLHGGRREDEETLKFA